MRRTGSRNVQIAFSAGRLTHFGGVYLLHRFLQQLHFRTFIGRSCAIAERNNHFSVTERLFALIYPMILGLSSVELTTLLGTNGVFQYLTGLPRFPNPSTLRRFLIEKAAVLLPQLQSVHNDLRSHFLMMRGRTSYWLDFDSTARTLYGNQEGVVKGYNPGKKGKKSYHPLVCTEAHTGECLGGVLRFGNSHTATGVGEMLERVINILPRGARTVRVRADAGFYDGDFIKRLSHEKIDFTVVAHMTSILREKMLKLKFTSVRKELATAEFQYKPHGWGKKYRFVVLREKMTDERREQLRLFTVDAYAYHALVTNLSFSPYGVFSFYEDRSGIERIIRTLKEDYPFATAPTNGFAANAMYTELSLLAYNIVVWFKHLCLPPDWQSFTIGTLRQRLLLVPGMFTKVGNRPKLRLPKSAPYQEVFTFAQKEIKKLRPLV